MGKVKGWKSKFRGADNRFSTVGETFGCVIILTPQKQGQAVQSQLGLHIKFQASRGYIYRDLVSLPLPSNPKDSSLIQLAFPQLQRSYWLI